MPFILETKVPVGTILDFAANLVPKGYLICDGSQVSKEVYPRLYYLLRGTWGSETSTTFRLPDTRGRFSRGYDAGTGVDTDSDNRYSLYGGADEGTGSYQSDDFTHHSHMYVYRGGLASTEAEPGPACWVGESFPQSYGTGGSETRPKNYSVIKIIKY